MEGSFSTCHPTVTGTPTSRNINEFDVRGVLSCSFAKL